MNDKKFREKCREIICQQLNELDEFFKGNKGYGFDPEVAKSVALLYIAANMPGLDEKAKQPCEYCNPKKRKIFHNPCGSISHYLYVNTKQKKLADVYDKTEDKWVAIKYCPFCRRKL